ncbi:MAG: hypothetical protein HQL73_10970 [Magnetococcales bacterium]|nr:hypothetical protein [Magnetococcales bacterium]
MPNRISSTATLLAASCLVTFQGVWAGSVLEEATRPYTPNPFSDLVRNHHGSGGRPEVSPSPDATGPGSHANPTTFQPQPPEGQSVGQNGPYGQKEDAVRQP